MFHRMDDPLMWGLLPISYVLSPRDIRYGLGSHDICFKNKWVYLLVLYFHAAFSPGYTLPSNL